MWLLYAISFILSYSWRLDFTAIFPFNSRVLTSSGISILPASITCTSWLFLYFVTISINAFRLSLFLKKLNSLGNAKIFSCSNLVIWLVISLTELASVFSV